MGFREEVLSQGYAILDGSKYLDIIDDSSIEFAWAEENRGRHAENDVKLPISNKEAVELALHFMHLQIAQDFLAPNTKRWSLKNKMIWEGTGKNASSWHSDYQESADVFFLLYFNDLKDDGAIWIKNTIVEERIPSTRGTLIAFDNNNPNCQHRAEATNQRRVVASFSYKVEW